MMVATMPALLFLIFDLFLFAVLLMFALRCSVHMHVCACGEFICVCVYECGGHLLPLKQDL